MFALQIAYADREPLSGSKLDYRLFSKKSRASVKVSGNRAVEQNIVKILLTNPGSDYFNQTLGGGLPLILSQSVSPDNLQTRRTEVGQAIIRTEEQLIASQVGLTLTPAERLSRIDIKRLDFDPSVSSWIIELALFMEDGNVSQVLLGR